MGILDRFRRHSSLPAVSHWKIRDEPGPVTAREAWSIVSPIAMQLEKKAKLIFITSGLDIMPDGHSYSWEFIYILPGISAQALFTLSPPEHTEDVENAQIYLTQRLNRASRYELQSACALPHLFRDSPEAVVELTGKGVDFVTGPSDMKLESRHLGSGEAVWVTYYWGEEYTVKFSA
jgi:hypothetical protein